MIRDMGFEVEVAGAGSELLLGDVRDVGDLGEVRSSREPRAALPVVP